MTAPHTHRHGNDEHDDALPDDLPAEQCHRYEIATAMDAVIRYCRTVVNEHSHRGRWAPTGDTPDTVALITQARTAILADLRMVLDCAETVVNDIERVHQQCAQSSE